MTNKFQIISLSAILLIFIGCIFYACYKRYYEKRINEVLSNQGKKVTVLSIAKVMAGYTGASLLILFMISYYVPTTGSTQCSLVSYVTMGELSQEEIEKTLVDDLKKDGQNYRFEQIKLDENLTALYANNDQEYGYYLQYRLGRDPQKNEVFYIQEDGANTWIPADSLKDGMLSFGFRGNRSGDCDVVTLNFRIYNFCEGENLYPIDIKRTITIKNGGTVS